MTSKTLQDFFGDKTLVDGEYLTFSPSQVISTILNENFTDDATNFTSEQIASSLIAYWFSTNYSDAVTGNRLSQDKTIPLVSNSATVRRNLVTRGDETQIKHDFSFSIYTKDNSEFNPDNLVDADDSSSL